MEPMGRPITPKEPLSPEPDVEQTEMQEDTTRSRWWRSLQATGKRRLGSDGPSPMLSSSLGLGCVVPSPSALCMVRIRVRGLRRGGSTSELTDR